jgi:hypothetical protein
MTTVTQFLLHPDDIKTMFIEVLKQASGNAPTGHAAIPVEELAPMSAAQAAHYLRCSTAHLNTLVGKYPEHLRPITEQGKATRFDPKELYFLKSKGLVK